MHALQSVHFVVIILLYLWWHRYAGTCLQWSFTTLFVATTKFPVPGPSLTIRYSVFSKTLLTQTSGDHPRTSVLTEVHVIQKLKNWSYSTFNYTHCKCNTNTHTIQVIVISLSKIRDHDWSYPRHVICINNQCCSMQQHPGEHDCGSFLVGTLYYTDRYIFCAAFVDFVSIDVTVVSSLKKV